jgi:hypothetical protein
MWALLGSKVVDPSRGVRDILIALSWLYATIRPILHPRATVPYDLLAIYFLNFAGGLFMLGGYIFDNVFDGTALPSQPLIVGLCANLVAILSLMWTALRLPVRLPPQPQQTVETVSLMDRAKIPSAQVTEKNSESSEDYASFWGVLTFGWVYPLIRRVCSLVLLETSSTDSHVGSKYHAP